ncbi:Storkhead-box protein 1-like protein [Leptotrombidium deliense]|uniref:Storkhead-box protein 1-like protein n=1 Tax=Leptotrombidium deliense TaxID=299467 RepID=A0A443SL54_9ACAR|nr:Storkhead-box protein 1-like protein [Leptotrombidium deliense]
MSPHSTFDCDHPNSITLIDNCLLLTLRKCELFPCQSLAKYANSYQWSSDVSELAFSPEPTLRSPPSPCFSYSASEGETLKSDSGQNGWSLFQNFVKENSNCFWNPSLIASVNSIEFRGFLLPCSLLLSGSRFDLEVIRSSWSRMTLKAPQGYAIESLGDIGSVEMTAVDQTHFTPLSEALCSSIHSLNIEGTAAFPHSIASNLRQKYPHLTPPSFESKRSEGIFGDTLSRKGETESKSTQTLEATKKVVAAKSETLKSNKSTKSIVHTNPYTYNTYVPCNCNAYTACVDRCAYESGRYLCITDLDPNCRHCLASLTNSNVCCNEFVISNGFVQEKQSKQQQQHHQHRPPQTGKAITSTPRSSCAVVDTIRPKTPLKLNNNKSVSNEKMKPIAMQTNAIHKENNSTSSEQIECHLTSIDNQTKKNSVNNVSTDSPVTYKKFADDRQSIENSAKKANTDCKLVSANGVNVKIEIGSKVTATSQASEPPLLSSRNVSNDAIISGSNLGQRLIANCVVDEQHLNVNPIQSSFRVLDGKQANVTSTTVTTTMTVPNVTISHSNQNYTIAKRATSKSDHILPLKYNEKSSKMMLDECTCKQKNLIVNALNAADLKKSDDDQISSISNIREKVAKAKAAFFNANNTHNSQQCTAT